MIGGVLCVNCGGTIRADAANPGPAVLAHQMTTAHRAWAIGLTAETLPRSTRLGTGDGQPVRLVDPTARGSL